MPVNQDRINYLLTQWLDKSILAPELNELSELLMEGRHDHQIENTFQSFINQLPDEGYADYKEADWEHLYQKIIQTPPARIITMEKERPARRQILSLQRIAIAASILLIISFGIAYVISTKEKSPPAIVNQPTDVKAPETNRAMITLADGRTVYLDSANNGTIATQNNITVIKSADGKIIYSHEGTKTQTALQYNTLSNPRGSKVIDMTLADGSRVWLNAGSSITYPVAFIDKERKVQITGEAYFEVTHDKTKPFYVTKAEMQVQVLGTHFNVNAYDDESEIRITLLEGSVKVSSALSASSAVKIKPGQQAVFNPANPLIQKILVQTNVDVDQVMAWKNGTFKFKSTDIRAIMRQLEKWYNVEVSYQGAVPNETITGDISRSVNLSQVLKMLEYAGLHFSIDGKKIIITK